MDSENNLQSGLIKPINAETVHRICSGQVVLSLAVAVKELVENSLDAGATIIEVRFKNYGTELIEVSDNGSGVTEDNFAALTLKYHTSKLKDYSDLLGVSSFGFRGEALSSLCALSKFTVTTRHQSASHATKLEYDHKGNIIKKTPCSRQVGTTVTLSDLFQSLPVRQKEFYKNVKREFNKMTQLLYAYCLISLGVKITCTNQTNANSKTVVVATQGSMSYKDNIACIFGMKQLQTIVEVKPENGTNIKSNIFKGLSQENEQGEEETIEDVEIGLSEDSNDSQIKESQDSTTNSTQKSQGYKNITQSIEFTGFISSCAHGSGRSSTDRQFYFVNSRPCEPNKIIKVINEVYRQFNPNQYPFAFLNVNIERTSVDVNVTPDKRKVFLTKEKIILDVLKNSLIKLFESIPRTLKVDSAATFYSKSDINNLNPDTEQPRIHNSFLQQFCSKSNHINKPFQEKKGSDKCDLKRKSSTILDFVSSKSMKKADNRKFVDGFSFETENEETELLQKKYVEEKTDPVKSDFDESVLKNSRHKNDHQLPSSSYIDTKVQDAYDTILSNSSLECENEQMSPTKSIKSEIMYLECTDKLPDTQIRNVENVVLEKTHTITCKTRNTHSKPNTPCSDRHVNNIKIVTDKEDLGKHNRKSIILKTSLEQIKVLSDIHQQGKHKIVPDRVKFRSVINPVDNKKCEEELSKEISKDSFKEMVVVGQFNLGFIITRLGDDLFIIDQHATDEIYNFETLQKSTELTKQKLVVPQSLELTGVNEQILMDNLNIFRRNGFTFEINEEAPPTKRVKLLTLPMSKNWIFGKEDIEELLFMLRESSSEYCRPSRVRAMFASRACRKSVMIGTALNKADMKKLVVHMSEIDKPWEFMLVTYDYSDFYPSIKCVVILLTEMRMPFHFHEELSSWKTDNKTLSEFGYGSY